MPDTLQKPAPRGPGAGLFLARVRVAAVGFMLSPGDPGYDQELERIAARRRELEAQRRQPSSEATP